MSAFKPGDVAMVGDRVAICGKRYVDDSLVWVTSSGILCEANHPDARPLVVIDPEDAEQVEKLLLARWRASGFDTAESGPSSRVIDEWQAALREFADPKPRIEEPAGLGAVVVDADGSLLVRISRDDQRPWRAEGGHRFDWAEVDAVSELSAGTEPLADWERDLLRGAS